MRRALAEDPDFAPLCDRLRDLLADASGKLRADDALFLAGFDRRSPARSRLLANAMRQLGWERGRFRFGGSLEYAFARGSLLEREVILEVDRGEDGRLVVRRREP